MSLEIYVLACILGALWLLRSMGRVWGIPVVWVPDTTSSKTSQGLADPYTFTHVLHGIIFQWLFGRFGRTGFLLAVAVECAWEVLENTDAVIQRYREETVSLGYNGDSVLNVVGDVGAMMIGYWFAASVPWYVSFSTVLLVEIWLAKKYKDNLFLNVLMLVYPMKAVKAWQQRESFTLHDDATLSNEIFEYAKKSLDTFIANLKEKHATNTIAATIARHWNGEVYPFDLRGALAAYEIPTGRLYLDVSAIKQDGWVTEERINGILLHELAHAYAGGHGKDWRSVRDRLFEIAIVDLGWKIDIREDEFAEKK